MCFGAFSLVSMVVAVVSIQLLRLGLVNHMSDGDTLEKSDHDPMVIMALGKLLKVHHSLEFDSLGAARTVFSRNSIHGLNNRLP